MKKTITLLFVAVLMVCTLAACGQSNNDDKSDIGSDTPVTESKEPTVTNVDLETASVTVYDYDGIKLHAFYSNDALGDVAYIIESEEGLVGVELPSFTEGLNEWEAYRESLNKTMSDMFICDHVTGASYVEGMTIYGTQGAKDSIESGSTFATTQGLYETFGDDFHGGDDMVEVNKVVSGTVTVCGIEFNLIDHGETYDLEIPEMNVVYTHMLGETSHSIITSTEHADTMLATLKDYQSKDYDMILSAHSGAETQTAVTAKIAYVEKVKELAASCDNAEEFTEAMKTEYPDYSGDNYLEMTAGYLFPAE